MHAFVSDGGLSPSFVRGSPRVVELLESITTADMALTQPYIKITRIDPKTGKQQEGIPPLNVYFQKPPFGAMMAGRTRYAERPPVSLEGMSITTELSYGQIVQQSIELNVTVHRPDAIFDRDEDSQWTSLITPGNTHLIEYGWTGTSKNDLINGNGLVDDSDIGGNNVVVPSRRTMLFTTYYYTFDIKTNGEISMVIKGWQNGKLILSKVPLGDVVGVFDYLNESNKPGENDKREILERKRNEAIRKELQRRLNNLAKNPIIDTGSTKKKFVKFIDVLNELIAPSLIDAIRGWGYNDTDLRIGSFNELIPRTSKSSNLGVSVKDIANFSMSIDEIQKIITKATDKGISMTLESFIDALIQIINDGSSWAPGETIELNKNILDAKLPTVVAHVSDYKDKSRGNVLRIAIIDERTKILSELGKELSLGDMTMARVKKEVLAFNIPFVSFGKAQSFIKDSSFEIINDADIQAAKIDEAARMIKTRNEFVSMTFDEMRSQIPDAFHVMWTSAMTGTVTMLGNFAFETFAYIWFNFGVSIWDGLFNVIKKTDSITSGNFETVLEIRSTGEDPLNTRRRLTDQQLEDLKRKREEQSETRRKAESKRKKARKK